MLQVYRAVRAHGTVVTLDGHGADELLGGYADALNHAMRDCPPWRLPGLRRIFNAMLPEGPQFRSNRLSLARAFARHAKVRMKNMLRPEESQSRDRAHPAYGRFDALGRNLYGIFHETILPTLLRNYDRYSMANSVEIRMPLMDHRLVTFAFSLPSASKLRGGLTKRILRDAAAPFMPREIAYRPGKIGFNSPILDWMKGPWREMFLDILESRDFRECSLIDSVYVAREVRHVIAADVSFRAAEQAWTDMAPYFWERGLRRVGWKVGAATPLAKIQRIRTN
jgi:asparagine synthase (glutamine-hydrolysing)